MIKSRYIDIFFETNISKILFDSWFENNIESFKEMNCYKLADYIDEYLEDGQYEDAEEDDDFIDDYTFGKNGVEKEYIESLVSFLDGTWK